MSNEVTRVPAEVADRWITRSGGFLVAPGKVTQTVKLSGGQRRAIQRSMPASPKQAPDAGCRSAGVKGMDPRMDAARHCAAAFPVVGQSCGQGIAHGVVQRQLAASPPRRETDRRAGPEYELVQNSYKSMLGPPGV